MSSPFGQAVPTSISSTGILSGTNSAFSPMAGPPGTTFAGFAPPTTGAAATNPAFGTAPTVSLTQTSGLAALSSLSPAPPITLSTIGQTMLGGPTTQTTTTVTTTGSLKIMTFLFNLDGMKICQSDDTQGTRVGILNKIFVSDAKLGFCIRPDFMDQIRASISDARPNVVVFTTTDEDSNKTYFHSNVLPKAMKKINYGSYVCISRHKVAQTDSSIINDTVRFLDINSKEFDIYGQTQKDFINQGIRYQTSSSSITRTSIYVLEKELDDYYPAIEPRTVTCKTDLGYGNYTSALCIYLNHINFGNIAFIAVCLPKEINILDVAGWKHIECFLSDDERRDIKFLMSRLCLTKILLECAPTSSANCSSQGYGSLRPTVQHTFLMGNFNFIISHKDYVENEQFDFFDAYVGDEMRQLLGSYYIKRIAGNLQNPNSINPSAYDTMKVKIRSELDQRDANGDRIGSAGIFSKFEEGILDINPYSSSSNVTASAFFGGPKFLPTYALSRSRDLNINDPNSCAFERGKEWNSAIKTISGKCYDFADHSQVSGKAMIGNGNVTTKNVVKRGPSKEVQDANGNVYRTLTLGWTDRILHRSSTAGSFDYLFDKDPVTKKWVKKEAKAANGSTYHAFQPRPQDDNRIRCSYYNIFEHANTSYASHAPILGIYEIGTNFEAYIDQSRGNIIANIGDKAVQLVATYNWLDAQLTQGNYSDTYVSGVIRQIDSIVSNLAKKSGLRYTREQVLEFYIYNEMIIRPIHNASNNNTFAELIMFINLVTTDDRLKRLNNVTDEFLSSYKKCFNRLKGEINSEYLSTQDFSAQKAQIASKASGYGNSFLKGAALICGFLGIIAGIGYGATFIPPLFAGFNVPVGIVSITDSGFLAPLTGVGFGAIITKLSGAFRTVFIDNGLNLIKQAGGYLFSMFSPASVNNITQAAGSTLNAVGSILANTAP